MLIQNSWAVSHKSDCFLTALFYRIAARRGVKRAAMAVAHRVLIIAYYIIRDGTEYCELGGNHYDRRNPERTARKLTRRLEQIGYQVSLTKPRESCSPQPDKPIRNGTTRWDTRGFRFAPIVRDPTVPIATPDVCRKCAKWKIPCLHKSKLLRKPTKDIPGESTP